MKRPRDLMASLRLLSAARMGSADDAARKAVVRTMFDRLRGGIGTADDFDCVAKALNTAKIRALEIGEPRLIDDLQAGQLAMTECRRRYMELGKFGFAGPEVKSMLDAILVYEEIERASSVLQMEQAWNTSCRSVQLNMKQGAKK